MAALTYSKIQRFIAGPLGKADTRHTERYTTVNEDILGYVHIVHIAHARGDPTGKNNNNITGSTCAYKYLCALIMCMHSPIKRKESRIVEHYT